jgi:cobaltochelatase CobN
MVWQPMATTMISARGEAFKIQQVQGNLFVCAEENGGCCCGHTEKGRADVNKDLYAEEWENHRLRNKVHLTFVGCLGPCPVGNNAMLQLHGRSIWFKDLNDDRFIPMIFDYIDAMVAAGKVLTPIGGLAEHVYERYVAPPMSEFESFAPAQTSPDEVENFDGVDPVCMMTVDPVTAQWHSEFEGTTYYFCAPSCKKSFDKDPTAYVKSADDSSIVAKKAAKNEPAAKSLAAVASAKMNNLLGDQNMTKTFVVPNISCDHCVRSIKNEVSDIEGVKSVDAKADTKVVTVEWESPATWEQINATLTEIDYPPQELIQL